MGIRYQPKEKSILFCDFKGTIAPEINKKRPVVIVSKHRHNSKLVTVIPLSTTRPTTIANYQHQLLVNPLTGNNDECWAKCDMIYTVSIDRLSLYRVIDEKGLYQKKLLTLDEESYKAIKKAVACALKIIIE